MEAGLTKQLEVERLVAIIRGIPQDKVVETVNALADGGITFVEVTLNSEGALGLINELRGKYGDRLRIGAGTVLDESMAKEAISAGAEYLLSPNFDEEVLVYGLDNGAEVWPGTMTPTEIVRAHRLGASAVKVFPIKSLGIGYIKELRAPLNHIPMIATGGVNLQNIDEVFANGAFAVGLGGNLVDKKLIQKGDFEQISQLARAYVERAKQVDSYVQK